jgi:lactoylglutathione lyase
MVRWPSYFLALLAVVAIASCTDAREEDVMELRPYSVTLSVADTETMSRWYAEVLGFEVVDRKDYPEFDTSLVFVEREGFRLEFIRDGKSEPVEMRPDPPAHTRMRGVSQIAFEVDDITATHAALRDKGVTFAWELQRYDDLGVAFFFVRDPEGNLVQFIERLD